MCKNTKCSYQKIVNVTKQIFRNVYLVLLWAILQGQSCACMIVQADEASITFSDTQSQRFSSSCQNVQSLHANWEAIFLNMYLAKVQASKNFTQRFMKHSFVHVHPIFGMKQYIYTLSSQLNMRMTCDKKLESFMQSCYIK